MQHGPYINTQRHTAKEKSKNEQKNTVKVIKMQTGSHIEVVSPDRYYAYVYCPVHFMSFHQSVTYHVTTNAIHE